MNIGPILRAMKHNRTRVVLIVLEIAITLAIVTNCVNVIVNERRKMALKSGFDDDNILWVRARPFAPEYRESDFRDTVTDSDLRAIQAVPGVRAVANTSFQFWEGGGSSTEVRPAGTTGDGQRSQIYWATKDIFETLGVEIVEGRGFREGDHGIGTEPDPANVTVISKALAETLFPEGGAVGKSIEQPQSEGEPLTVIGVMEHFYNPYGMPGGDVQAIEERAMFLPARVSSYSRGIRYLVRTEPGALSSVTGEIERRLTAAQPGRVFEFLSMPEKKERWFGGSRIVVNTMTSIIVALVGVTALGLLGLTSLAVAERTKQIGTRRALGATRAEILRHFLVENWLITTAGLLLGLVAAYALNVLLVSEVTGMKLPWELAAGGVVLLWINGLLATIPPALRATRIPPAIATRSV